jgi:hypothetical protein
MYSQKQIVSASSNEGATIKDPAREDKRQTHPAKEQDKRLVLKKQKDKKTPRARIARSELC